MKKNSIVILLILLIHCAYSQKNQYSFGYGINTIDPLNSQVLFIDYNRLIKKHFSLGFIYQNSSSNYTRMITSSYQKIHAYYKGYTFSYPELLTNNELKIGAVKMQGFSQTYQDNIWIPNIGYGWEKKHLVYNFSLGIGLIEYSIRGQGLAANAVINNDSTNQAYLIVPYIVRGLSLAIYTDFKFLYQLKKRFLIGTKVSFNYDLLDGGGFPLQNTLLVAIKF